LGQSFPDGIWDFCPLAHRVPGNTKSRYVRKRLSRAVHVQRRRSRVGTIVPRWYRSRLHFGDRNPPPVVDPGNHRILSGSRVRFGAQKSIASRLGFLDHFGDRNPPCVTDRGNHRILSGSKLHFGDRNPPCVVDPGNHRILSASKVRFGAQKSIASRLGFLDHFGGRGSPCVTDRGNHRILSGSRLHFGDRNPPRVVDPGNHRILSAFRVRFEAQKSIVSRLGFLRYFGGRNPAWPGDQVTNSAR
jgi:hypothetical protein